jgi:hypothetical protein
MGDIFKPGPSLLERTERELQKIENEIVSEASEVVHSALRFSEVDPERPEELPPDWLDELNALQIGTPEHEQAMERLQKRFRVAKAAWMSAKNAPVALSIAKGVLVGAMKARAMADQGPKHLNINVVSITAPLPVFPEKKVEHE